MPKKTEQEWRDRPSEKCTPPDVCGWQSDRHYEIVADPRSPNPKARLEDEDERYPRQWPTGGKK